MQSGLTSASASDLAFIERDGFVESIHIGAGVVTAAGGETLFSVGDPTRVIFPRSCLKLLQTISVLRLGTPLKELQIGIAAASHSGTSEHLRVVKSILDDFGFDEDSLMCPAHWPSDEESAFHARRSGGKRKISMTCSGKHAAFLAACRHMGWPVDSYLEIDHPLQLFIRATIEEFTGESTAYIGYDACGAPVFSTSLLGLSKATGLISAGKEPASMALVKSVLQNPWVISGPNTPTSIVVEQLGLIAKVGGEGVFVIGSREGNSACVKILDGNPRALVLVVLELFVRAGLMARNDADRVLSLAAQDAFGAHLRIAF